MKERIDKLLVDRGLCRTRQQAQACLMAGWVLVNEQRIDKPGVKVEAGAAIRLKEVLSDYVSRGGLKLEKALDTFAPSLDQNVCLDIGASTGGFTECMLRRGARKVYAVDVGHNQLDWRVRSDPRVVVLEGVNARYLSFEAIGEQVDLITIDVSFISLTLIFPVLKSFLKPEARVLCLVKPQFEVGKGEVGKGGLVKDPRKHQEVLDKIRHAAEDLEYQVEGIIDSPILGMEGNKEFFLAMKLPPGEMNCGLM
jgi:23S rRNA (cytidine1920-2'-O)/16S rRNA (cytidine1409-2'-O)-methyltransferase